MLLSQPSYPTIPFDYYPSNGYNNYFPPSYPLSSSSSSSWSIPVTYQQQIFNNNNNNNICEMITFGNSHSIDSSTPWIPNGTMAPSPASSVNSSSAATNTLTPITTTPSVDNNFKLFEIKTEQLSPMGSSSGSGPNSAPTNLSSIDTKDGIIGSVGSLPEQRTQSDLNVYSKCTVCEDVADGYHFSALSCAACSAFFRRSIADQKTYACVTRNCNVSINSRKHGVICRYCRFQRCIVAGMCPDEVQGKRTKILPESPGRSSPASVTSAPYPTLATLRRGSKAQRTSQARGPHVPLLNEMAGARRTLGNHRMMNVNCPPTTQPPTVSQSALIQPFAMLEKEYIIFKKFCENVGMLNGLITDSDHWQFSTEVQNLFLTWVIFESVHATIRFGGIQTNRAYAGDLSNIDIDESSLTAYLSDGNTRDAASMARFAYPVLQFFNMHLCRNVQNMRLDEKEAAALMCLLLIHQVKSRPIEPFKHQIFKELGEHYRNYEVDASVRLANIVLIISTFDEALGKAKEFLTCWNLFSFKF